MDRSQVTTVFFQESYRAISHTRLGKLQRRADEPVACSAPAAFSEAGGGDRESDPARARPSRTLNGLSFFIYSRLLIKSQRLDVAFYHFADGAGGSFRQRYSFDSPGSIRGTGDLWPAVRLPHAPGRRTRKLAKDAPVDIDENSSKPDIALLAQRFSTRHREFKFQ